jgi:hypothetical protein
MWVRLTMVFALNLEYALEKRIRIRILRLIF